MKFRAVALVAVTCASWAAVAIAQAAAASAAPTLASSSGDPINALWSLLGSSPTAFVLWQWAKGEQKDRRDAVSKMVHLFEADVEHKVTVRERLKGQDDALAKTLEVLQRIERSLGSRFPGRPGA